MTDQITVNVEEARKVVTAKFPAPGVAVFNPAADQWHRRNRHTACDACKAAHTAAVKAHRARRA